MLGKVRAMATINDARLREILTGSPTVAVLGVHKQPEKAAYYVPEYLHDEGYRVIGVNPEFTTETFRGCATASFPSIREELSFRKTGEDL